MRSKSRESFSRARTFSSTQKLGAIPLLSEEKSTHARESTFVGLREALPIESRFTETNGENIFPSPPPAKILIVVLYIV